MKTAKSILLLLAIMGASIPLSHTNAQMTVRESHSEWQKARMLQLERAKTWCEDSNSDGCDLKDITEAIELPDRGVAIAYLTGPINRLDEEGTFRGTIGGRGQGPGEYRSVLSLQLVSPQLLAWYDQFQRRITSVTLSNLPGAVSQLRPPITIASAHLTKGKLVVLDVPATKSPGDTVTATYKTVLDDGSLASRAQVRIPSYFSAGSAMRPPPALFEPTTIAHVGWNGDIAHSHGTRYEVDVFPASGSPWKLLIDLPVQKVTSTERDSAVTSVLVDFKAKSVAALPPAFRARVEGARTTWPIIQDIRVLRDGTIWIKPRVSASSGKARWDLFAPNGRRVGQVQLPVGAVPKDGEKNWVLTVESTVDDLPVVVKYLVR